MQKAYLFNNGDYVRFDIPTDKVEGKPAKMDTNSWAGFPAGWSRVDAALNLGNGKIYMFNGNTYIRFDIIGDRVDQEIRPIGLYWEGFPASWSKIDAAVNWGNGKAYMFNGEEYIRYDILQDRIDQGIRPIKGKGNWNGFPDRWHKVDAVLNWGDDRIYMFNGSEYLRFSILANKVDIDPRPILKHWTNFPGNWSKIDDGVVIDYTAERMGSKIESLISPQTVGFAYVIHDNKRLVKSGYGGSRVKAIKGTPFKSSPFSINTQMGIGSITKSLTAMATLNCMKDRKLLDSAGLVDVETKIGNFLPKTWLQGMNVSSISFKQLLTHTSGIPPSPDESYGTLKFLISAGVVGTKHNFKYSNANFALMRIIIPIMNSVPVTNNEQFDAMVLAEAYKSYMQQRVFEPSGVRNADCMINSDEYAMMYGPPSDESGPYSYDDHDDSTLICGAGGWKLSVLELSKVINTFFTTERILPEPITKQMLDKELGCYQESASMCVKATHNGAWGDTKGYRNCYHIFNDGIQCVLMTNSIYGENPITPEFVVEAAHALTFGCSP
jgi:CubicO group peptidase (beta-lactamase class C family)